MKKRKLLAFGVALLTCIATFSLAEALMAKNSIGIIKIELPPAGEYAFVGVNFGDDGETEIPLSTFISTSCLIGHLFPTLADSVFIYDPSKQGYDQYFFDGGIFKDAVTFQPAYPVVHSGGGFWLSSSNTSTNTRDIYLLGEIVMDDTFQKSIVESYQQIGNPFATDFNLNNVTNWIDLGATTNSSPAEADNVHIWNGDGYDEYYLEGDGKWYDCATFELANNAVIPVGGGAWYEAVTNFTLILDRPYLGF